MWTYSNVHVVFHQWRGDDGKKLLQSGAGGNHGYCLVTSVRLTHCRSHYISWNYFKLIQCDLLLLILLFLSLFYCLFNSFKEIIRTVLSNLDSLQPFSSTHFNVFPCILYSEFVNLFIPLGIYLSVSFLVISPFIPLSKLDISPPHFWHEATQICKPPNTFTSYVRVWLHIWRIRGRLDPEERRSQLISSFEITIMPSSALVDGTVAATYMIFFSIVQSTGQRIQLAIAYLLNAYLLFTILFSSLHFV